MKSLLGGRSFEEFDGDVILKWKELDEVVNDRRDFERRNKTLTSMRVSALIVSSIANFVQTIRMAGVMQAQRSDAA